MLRLRYRSDTLVPIEAPAIRPDTLAGLSLGEIERLTVYHGNRQEPLAEFFDLLGGDPSDAHLVIEGDCARVKWLGARMQSGMLRVEGNAGMHTGAEMRGGRLLVTGNTSDWLGAEMRGGLIEVHGDTGHLPGAGYRGSRKGMRGGCILVRGNAGNEVGALMRRGLIAVGGSVGDFAGVSLIAGTILLFGPAGIRPGAGMKRGTIALLGPSVPLLPSFRHACQFQPTFLALYLRQLQAWHFPPASRFDMPPLMHRYNGDLVALGKGEILTVASPTL